MKKILPLLLCLLFGFSQYSWSQSGGGFPSNPKFSTTVVRGNTTGATCANGFLATLCTNSVASTGWSHEVTSTAAAGSQLGLSINVGSISTDIPLRVANANATATFFQVTGNGVITAASATSVPWIVERTGTFTLTYTSGCTSGTLTPSFEYVIEGHIATLTTTAAASCTTTAAVTMGGLPAALQPVTNSAQAIGLINTNGTSGIGALDFGIGSATVQLVQGFPTTFTGVTGFPVGATFTYSVQ